MSTRATLSVDGQIARLTLRSADGENRLDATTLADLAAACAAARDAAAVRVLIVYAEGAYFSLGWDAATLADPEAAGLPGDPFGALAALRQPVLCSLTGDAASGGLELALACDVRVAALDARFALPETAHGLLPLAGGTQRLPRLVGRGHAAELVLLGDIIDGATALDWGLVSAAVARDQVEAESERLAAVIAARGPIAERFAKEAIEDGIELPLARALRFETDLTILLQTTADRAEGVQAFKEKRPPRFTGT